METVNNKFFRETTKEDIDFYEIDVPLESKQKTLTPKDKFNKKLAQEEHEAAKKGLPFSTHAARADYKDAIEEFTKSWKRQGFASKELPKIDWDKYSNLKNFEIVKKGKVHDKDLSKIHRLPIFVEYVTYKFKGFSNEYTVQEDGELAVQRALKTLEDRNLGKTKSSNDESTKESNSKK